MTFEGALLREQGVEFGVVIVKPHVLHTNQGEEMIEQFSRLWGGIPVVLMAQDGRGVPTYYGRRDLAKFMASVPMNAVPWRRYHLS